MTEEQREKQREYRNSEEYRLKREKYNLTQKKYRETHKEKIRKLQKEWKKTSNGKKNIARWRVGYRERTGCNLYERRPYTQAEEQMILEHSIPDRELSEKIQRSVTAIQHQRHRLKKTEELGEGWERRKQ